MVQLIDMILVSGIVGGSVYALIRYLMGLGKVEESRPVSCSGCSTCHPAPIEVNRPV